MDERLDKEEKLDYIVAGGKGCNLSHPVEVQITSRVISEWKFDQFVKTRHIDRFATSVYLVLSGMDFVPRSVDVMHEFLHAVKDVKRRSNDVIVIALVGEGPVRLFTEQEYREFLRVVRAESQRATVQIASISDRRIRVRPPPRLRRPYEFADIWRSEIVDQRLLRSVLDHESGRENIIGTLIEVGLHPAYSYAIDAKYPPGHIDRRRFSKRRPKFNRQWREIG